MGTIDKQIAKIAETGKQGTFHAASVDASLEQSNAGLNILGWIEGKAGFNKNFQHDVRIGGTQATNAIAASVVDATKTAMQITKAAPGAVKAVKSGVPVVLDKVAAIARRGKGTVATTSELVLDSGVVTDGAEVIDAAAPALSTMSKIARFAGPAAVVLTTGAAIFEYNAASKAGDGYRKAKTLGHLGGGMLGIVAGAEAGAVIGTLIPVPVLGTVAGLVVGGLIGCVCTWAGGKTAEKHLGPAWQASTDRATKAVYDKEIAELNGIQKKFQGISALGSAQEEFNAAMKSNDPAKIAHAKKDLDAATRLAGTFQGLSAAEIKRIGEIKKDLSKAYVNETSLQIPDEDHAAKVRQRNAIKAITGSVGTMDALLAADQQIKHALTPAAREQIVKANTQLQHAADHRIAQLHHQGAANEQVAYEQKLAKTLHPLLKFDKASPAISAIMALEEKLKDPNLTQAQLDDAKQQLAKLNIQKAHEQKEIARVRAELAKERRQQQAMLHNPSSRKFAAANIQHIDELQEKLNAFDAQYATVEQSSQKTLQLAEVMVKSKSGQGDKVAYQAPGANDLSHPMKNAVTQAQTSGVVLASNAPIKNTTLADGQNPVAEKNSLPQTTVQNSGAQVAIN